MSPPGNSILPRWIFKDTQKAPRVRVILRILLLTRCIGVDPNWLRAVILNAHPKALNRRRLNPKTLTLKP
eukprot:6997553-Pyramimonas_sp.AAC.3